MPVRSYAISVALTALTRLLIGFVWLFRSHNDRLPPQVGIPVSKRRKLGLTERVWSTNPTSRAEGSVSVAESTTRDPPWSSRHSSSDEKQNTEAVYDGTQSGKKGDFFEFCSLEKFIIGLRLSVSVLKHGWVSIEG